MLFNQDDDRSYFKSMEHCGLVAVADAMPRKEAHLMIRKNSPLLKKLNEAIKQNRMMIPKIVGKYFDKSKARVHCNDNKVYRPLKLIPYTGLFLVCLIVVGFAFFVFMAEIMSKRFCCYF